MRSFHIIPLATSTNSPALFFLAVIPPQRQPEKGERERKERERKEREGEREDGEANSRTSSKGEGTGNF